MFYSTVLRVYHTGSEYSNEMVYVIDERRRRNRIISCLSLMILLCQVIKVAGYERDLSKKFYWSRFFSSSSQTLSPPIPQQPKPATNKRLRDGIGFPKGYFENTNRYSQMIYEQKSGLPKRSPFLVLGIESSCDDTAVGIVSSAGQILANIVYSQHKIHENFGGVVPGLAMEEHRSKIDIAVAEALQQANLPNGIHDIDAIAVTKGPGLEICLRVGIRKAQQLAREYQKPFITIHHLEAHSLVARVAGKKLLSSPTEPSPPLPTSQSVEFSPVVNYPFLVVLVSGGHTSLLLCKDIGSYEFLGGTLDDALGEAFDKAARLLGLKSATSAGAAIEQSARLYKEKYYHPNQKSKFKHVMTVPMKDKDNFHFSYAGLKNAFRKEVMRARETLGLDANVTNAPKNQHEEVESTVTLPEDITSFLSFSFQDIAFKHLEDRLQKVLKYLHQQKVCINGIVVVGGVASNLELRRRLLEIVESERPAGQSIPLVFPPPSLCTDNGVMVAWCGVEKALLGISNEIDGQEPIPKWPVGVPYEP